MHDDTPDESSRDLPPPASTSGGIEHKTLSVVGIGASAGGLEAISELLRNLPSETGMAFVFVSHLDPAHESALTSILAKVCKLPVREARDGDIMIPNHVYVIPPNTDMVLAGETLRLTARAEQRGPHMPVDLFLRSLAKERHRCAAGVVLSGTGSDGTLGLKAVKEAGGITFAQDATARHDGMPRSAIAMGCVDFILPPARIASELGRLARDPYLNPVELAAITAAPVETETTFQAIVRLLSRKTGTDFAHYKQPTLLRRIQRRMALRRLSTFEAYLDCLRAQPEELQALCQEVLIQVTSFFRDAPSFDVLKRVVFPRLIENRPADAPIRIWVPGCSTGEEVYSIAISLLEFLEETGDSTPIKMFGTDIGEQAIEAARAGTFVESISSDVSPERLRRFFIRTERGFQIGKSVREMCIFARQDVTKDPPFSDLDLISCRNVLIYLGPVLQSRVMPIFHYALKPNGFLMLGEAEAIGSNADLFEQVDRLQRVYRKKPGPNRLPFAFTRRERSGSEASLTGAIEHHPAELHVIQREFERVLLDRYAPAAVLVNSELQIVRYRGNTGLYLQPAAGVPTHHLLQMAREGLLSELQSALDRAKSAGGPERVEGVRVRSNGHFNSVSLQVIPITDPSTDDRYFAVAFEPAAAASAEHAPPRDQTVAAADPAETDRQIAALQQELAAVRTYLQSVIEEQDAANEELKAANEEIVSSNEELQSTNEELETAKEELQATNEELTTVNDELQNRILVTTRLSDDLANLIDSVNIPTVVLDHELHVCRFSPSAKRVLNLLPSDIGRRIGDFKPKISIPDLEPLIEEVLSTLAVREREVFDSDGRCYTMVIRPYRTQDNKIDGAILTLNDVESLKQKERELEAARNYAVNIVETLREPLLVLDLSLRVQSANRAFHEMFHISPADARGRLVFTLANGQWDSPSLRTMLEAIRDKESEFHNFRLEHDFSGLGRRSLLLNGRRVRQPEKPASELILVAMEDITPIKEAEESRQKSDLHIRAIVENAAEGIITIDEQGLVQSFNRAAEQMFGYRTEEVLGRNIKLLMPAPYHDEHDRYLANYAATRVRKIIGIGREVVGRRKNGETFPMLLAVSEVVEGNRRTFTGLVRDISDLRAAQERALQAERLAAIGEAMTGLTHESRNALQRMQSCLEMLAFRVAGNTEAVELITRLQMAQDELHQLYEEVRQYAAPVASRRDPCHIGEVLHEAWNDVIATHPARIARLHEQGTGTNLVCEVNHFALHQVFRNILENSLAACADPVEIDVRYSDEMLDERPALKMSLCDNGPGFTAEQAQRIFEPFYTTKTRGTGLGMAIVKRIVAIHGGRVEVGSGTGAGAEIIVTLPRTKP
jgi:two-component system, chemotaxis family, CheB/CheR fusion protein